MSDVYVPGLRSRFNTEKIVEDLMKIERLPKEKAEQNIDSLETRKTWWQDLGRRVTSLRESARMLYSFQNPFNERSAFSSNEGVITATATREADENDYQFTVKQLAQADRFLSSPLDEKMTVDAGQYAFSLGQEEVSFDFKGGSLKEFVDAVNRRGRGKLGASLITVQSGSKSLLLESKVTGSENRLGFSGDSLQLAVRLGIVEPVSGSPAAPAAAAPNGIPNEDTVAPDALAAGSLAADSTPAIAAAASSIAALPAAGVADDTDAAAASAESASAVAASAAATASAVAAATAGTDYRPLNAVSTAQDAVITMEGIEMTRSSNVISDIVPGVTITVKGVSQRPERVEIQADHEGIKNSIISLVGNYNRLMAELNVLTRTDDRLVDELVYLDRDEAEEMRKRLGAFAGDSTLVQFRANLLRAVSSSYPTDEEQTVSMLAQIGISTNTRVSGGTGYNPSRLRGYLEIDEQALDAAMEQHLPAIRQLFASNTSGDLLADTGVAYNLDALSRPFVEIGGIISLKTGTIDSKVSQDKRRIDTMERQLAAKEADLKAQYSRMESAYARMEQMSTSLDNFSQRANNNR